MKNFFVNVKHFLGIEKKNEEITVVKTNVVEKEPVSKQPKSKKKVSKDIPTITLDTITITAKRGSTSNDTGVKGPDQK